MSNIDISNILNGLNPVQKQAVECLEGPLLIMAGAGSGKTRVLTCRIANLLAHGVAPYNILAITFTNKAATEMRERVERMIGAGSKDIWLSTFHSFCSRILRREIEVMHQLGYKKNFTIYDTTDTKSVVKACLKEMNIDEKMLSVNAVISEISKAKNQMMGPMLFARQAQDFNEKRMAEIYQLYTNKLRANNALDFDDLLMLTVTLFKEYEEVRVKYQKRFRYILVDEYQDTNGAQYELTNILAGGYRNLCVVGDADQSIYGWRGADMRNIMNFKRDYPEARKILLEQNYRSTKNILNAANAVIKNNVVREPKNLWTDNGEGDPITVYQAMNERDEAQYVLDNIAKQKMLFNAAYGDIAILYRTNAQSRVLEEAFMKNGIPYTIVGGLRFYDRMEIKDMLAYLRLIYNPFDNVSLLRIINTPKRGIGDTTLNKLSVYAMEHEMSIFELISTPDELANVDKLTARSRKPLENFATFIMECMNKSMECSVHELLDYIMDKSGYIKALEESDSKKTENESRIENLKEFIGVAKEFEKSEEDASLENFLNTVALVSDVDNAEMGDDRVNLMTFHSAKGLEFPVVFMVGIEEGIFPSSRSMYDESQMEEERRTCYVGITRAQRKLFITYAYERTIYGKTSSGEKSRFIDEIPDNLKEDDRRQRRSSFNNSFSSFDNFYGFNAGNFGGNTGNRPARPTSRPAGNYNAGSNFVPSNIGNGRASSNSKPMSGLEVLQEMQFADTSKRMQTRPMQSNSSRPMKTGIAAHGPIQPNPTENYTAGDKVRHGKWGVGTIVAVDDKGADLELKVAFPGQGIKTLQRKYAPIEKL